MTGTIPTTAKVARVRKPKPVSETLDIFPVEDPARVGWRAERDHHATFGGPSERVRRAAEAVTLRQGRAWRVFRRLDLGPHAALGYDALQRLQAEFFKDVDLACEAFGVTEKEDTKPGEATVMWSWGGHIGWRELWPHQAFEEWHGFWRFFTLVVKVDSREDVEILRCRSEQKYEPVEGRRDWCDPFDPRTVSARAWGPVLFEDRSLVARLNGRSGDAVVAWLRQLFGRGAWHGARLLKDADPGIFVDSADVKAILDALVAREWIFRGNVELTIEQRAMGWSARTKSLQAQADFDPTFYVYVPNRESAEAAALLRAEGAPRTCPPQSVYHPTTMRWIREVYRRGRVHGSELVEARAREGGMEDGSTDPILYELCRLGYVTADGVSAPTSSQVFLGLGGQQPGNRRPVSSVACFYEPQRDRSRWVEFPAWIHDIIASTSTGEPAPRPEEEASR